MLQDSIISWPLVQSYISLPFKIFNSIWKFEELCSTGKINAKNIENCIGKVS